MGLDLEGLGLDPQVSFRILSARGSQKVLVGIWAHRLRLNRLTHLFFALVRHCRIQDFL